MKKLVSVFFKLKSINLYFQCLEMIKGYYSKIELF
jgi:hypothetical protein